MMKLFEKRGEAAVHQVRDKLKKQIPVVVSGRTFSVDVLAEALNRYETSMSTAAAGKGGGLQAGGNVDLRTRASTYETPRVANNQGSMKHPVREFWARHSRSTRRPTPPPRRPTPPPATSIIDCGGEEANESLGKPRKLKAQSSHPESPQKKVANVEAAQDSKCKLTNEHMEAMESHEVVERKGGVFTRSEKVYIVEMHEKLYPTSSRIGSKIVLHKMMLDGLQAGDLLNPKAKPDLEYWECIRSFLMVYFSHLRKVRARQDVD